MAIKKIESIKGLGKLDKLTVQKSLPLFALWQSDLTLSEFKILDMYLSRIDSHHPERRQIVLEKGEVERALGIKKINNQDLRNRLRHLMGNVVEIPDNTIKKGFRLVTLFEEAVAEQEDDELWQVKLECTQKAMKYFFNIENLGYLRYKLRCVTSLTSRYTYIMFIYLEHNRYKKSWTIALDDLKHILNCDKEDTYKEYKHFNNLILKRIQKEMHDKTECRYSYEPIKSGRKVTAIHFTVETFADKIKALTDQRHDDPERLLEQKPTESEFIDEEDIISQLRQVCSYDFTLEEIQSAYNFAKTFLHDKAVKTYFEQTYLKLLEIEKNKKIRNRFKYFYSIICNDADRQRKEQQEREIERSQGYEATYDIAEYESTSIIDKLDDWDN